MSTPHHQPIVCGTDFSEPAQHAMDVAAALAKRLGTRLLLVHGVDERGDIPPHYWPRFMVEDRPQLETEASRLRERGIEVEEQLTGGVLVEGVARCAEKADARLIVLGSAGKGTGDRWVLGSTTERIAESAAMPTLVVRDAAPLEAWARGERALKVFVGADFTPVSDAALRWVSQLREIGACEITLGYIDYAPDEGAEMAIFDALNIVEETPEARARNEHDLHVKAEHWLGVQPVMLRVAPGSTRIDAHLLQLSREAQADLIVVGTHQWHGLSRLRHPSVSRHILRNARTNVACIPSPAAAAGASAQVPEVRRVLVATDLSEHGERAIPHAYSVLGAGSVVCVLHVLRRGEEREPVLAQLKTMIPTEATRRGIQTEVEVVENHDAAEAICGAAEHFDADLICISSHGRSGLLAAVMGSVAQATIARSTRPVLVVRPPS